MPLPSKPRKHTFLDSSTDNASLLREKDSSANTNNDNNDSGGSDTDSLSWLVC